MKWKGLREKYPDSWVLFEAVQAHSNEGKRIVDDLAVLDTFNDSDDAIRAYRDLHKKIQEENYMLLIQKSKNLKYRKENGWVSRYDIKA